MNRAWQYTMAFAMVIGPGAAAVMGQPAIPWSTIDGGGGASSGGGFELSGTVGQPDASAASALTGGGYELTGGYWGVILPACTVFAAPDFDQDCSVDNQDLAIFEACATGPSVPYNPASLPRGCFLTPDAQGHIAADLDADGDVDQDDFGLFQRCFSGPTGLADPNCLD